MTQVTSSVPLKGSRLVEQLTDLGAINPPKTQNNIAENLAKLIDLSDAFMLSDALRGLSRTPVQTTTDSTDNIKADVIELRSEMIENIVRSFVPDAGSMAFHLPTPGPDSMLDEKQIIEAYQRFYAIHQSELEFSIQKLRVQLCKIASGRSAEMAQMAALDSAINDTIADHSRKLFASIPNLVAKRYQALRKQHEMTVTENQQPDSAEKWLAPGGWLNLFYQEMQNLLLAELDVRMQPILGLVEALDHDDQMS